MGSQKTLKSFATWKREESLQEYSFWVRKFKKLLLTMFEWEGLSELNISERFLETSLYDTGSVIFYQSKEFGGFVLAKATPIGLNLYDEPIAYRAFSNGVISGEYVKASDCVVIWNDYLLEPSIGNVNYFAKRLSGIDKTMDGNLEQLKNPTIFTAPEGQVETIKSIMKDKSNYVPYIIVTADYQESVQYQLFNPRVENHLPQLQTTKIAIINEALNFFGINNANTEKKERMISDEVNQNNEQVGLSRHSMLRPRQEACKRIKLLWNKDVSVKFSPSLNELVEEFKNVNNNSI